MTKETKRTQLSWREMTASEILYSLGYGDVVDPRLVASDRLQIILDAMLERDRRNQITVEVPITFDEPATAMSPAFKFGIMWTCQKM